MSTENCCEEIKNNEDHDKPKEANFSECSQLQACLFGGVAIYGILLYTCGVDHPGSDVTLLQFISVVYFSNHECSSTYNAGTMQFNLKSTNHAAERTMGVLCVYAILSVMWIITSLMLITQAIRNKQLKSKTLRWLHYPWAAVSFSTVIMDIIATILYCVDFLQMNTLDTWLTFLNIKIQSNSQEILDNQSTPTTESNSQEILDMKSTPTIVMVLFSCRMVLIWLINIVLILYVVKASMAISSARSMEEIREGALAAQMAPPPPGNVPHRLTRARSAVTIETSNVYALPRLVSKDGIFTNADHRPDSPSPLHMASLQGFNYEKTNLEALSGYHSSITSKDGTLRARMTEAKRPWSLFPPTMLRNQLPSSYDQSRDKPATAQIRQH